MITPNALKKGDKVAIISTARKITLEEVSFAKNTLESWGLQVVFGKNLFEVDHQFAGNDAQRTYDLQTALNDNSIRAIICARGGYGTVRIVDKIDFTAFTDNPKWICGYSDVTALHSNVQQKIGIETLHSTMPINFETNTDEALNSFKKSLFGEPINYELASNPFNKTGKATGEVIGGNLSMLYSILGSRSSIDTKGKILFIEDLDEYLYHIDRMMMNLKRNGYLHNLAGIVIGAMSDMNDNTIPFGKNALEIINEHVIEYNYPICFGFPAGHIDNNKTLILGRAATLEVKPSATTLNFNV